MGKLSEYPCKETKYTYHQYLFSTPVPFTELIHKEEDTTQQYHSYLLPVTAHMSATVFLLKIRSKQSPLIFMADLLRPVHVLTNQNHPE